MMFIAYADVQVQIHQVEVGSSELWSRVHNVLSIAVHVFVPKLFLWICIA